MRRFLAVFIALSMLDALIQVNVGFCQNSGDSLFHAAYIAYSFVPEEGWQSVRRENSGGTSLSGKVWSLDFTGGAEELIVRAPDFGLMGSIDRIHLRAKGAAPGHPVRLYLRTHFMTFYKDIGSFDGAGEQVLSTGGPPGEGWKWRSGENDGRIHGPLRLTEIAVLGNGKEEKCSLELINVRIEASSPPDKKCQITARTREIDGRNHFTATLRSISEVPLNGKLSWRISNWEGRMLDEGKRNVTIPARTEPVLVTVPVNEKSFKYKFIEANFSLEVPGQEIYPADACWVEHPEPHGTSALEPESSFGMDLRVSWHEGDEREEAARMGMEAGVKWSREPFSWSRVQPREGIFEWDYYDAVMECAKRYGISLYVLVHGWANWTDNYTEKGIEQYLVYLRALVERYRGFVKHWEIWNEPNIFFWQGPKEMYPRLLERAYAVIKEADPEAEVLGISTAGIGWDFIKMVLDAKAPFDVLTIHPYRRVLEDRKFIDELKKVYEIVRLPDGTPRPVWITEMGWTTYTPHHTIRQGFRPVTFREQAQMIARVYLTALVSGVRPKTSWYNFRDSGEDPTNFEHGLGTLYHDFRPKPSYIAYSTLTRILKGLESAEKLEVGGNTFAYRFSARDGSEKIVIALWNPEKDIKLNVPVSGSGARIINAIGEEKKMKIPSGKMELLLPAGSPIYVIEKE